MRAATTETASTPQANSAADTNAITSALILALTPALADREPDAALAILVALAQQPTPRATGVIETALAAPDALVRRRATASLGHGGREARAHALAGAIAPHPRRGAALAGRPVLLVDDVMTSGATLSACTEAARAAGATDVRVLVLARALREP